MKRSGSRYAGAFLVPAEHRRAEAGSQRRGVTCRELMRLKRFSSVSAAAMFIRLRDVGILSVSAVEHAFRTFARSWRASEPDPISADMARKDFRVARRPFPYIRWDNARLTEIVTIDDEHGPGQAGLILSGRVHEASGVPTTLRRARVRLRVGSRAVGGVEGPGAFRDLPVAPGALLFGQHLYYPLHDVREGLIVKPAEYKEFARRSRPSPIIAVEVELVVSGPEQQCETWCIDAWLSHSRHEQNGYALSVQPLPPVRQHESHRADDSDRAPVCPHPWAT